MSAKVNVTVFEQYMKEWFTPPGEPVKQWVLDARARRAELERTGARLTMPVHDDNCGSTCRYSGTHTLVHDLATHDCCLECNEAGDTKRVSE